MSNQPVDSSRRTWIRITCAAGAVGGVAAAVPFVASLEPSERARAAGAPVEADISALKPGQKMTVEWRGKPVWILRRTPEMLDTLKGNDHLLADPHSERHQDEYTPMPSTRNEWRSVKPEYLVVVGICTHLGCSPLDKFATGSVSPTWDGGFLCPCHGSLYDLAGRVYKNMPAPDNLPVPEYTYLSDTKILIGEAPKA